MVIIMGIQFVLRSWQKGDEKETNIRGFDLKETSCSPKGWDNEIGKYHKNIKLLIE